MQQNNIFFNTQQQQGEGTRVPIWPKASIPPNNSDRDVINHLKAGPEILKEHLKEKIPWGPQGDSSQGEVQKEVAALDKNYDEQKIYNSTNGVSSHYYHGIKLSLTGIIPQFSELQEFEAPPIPRSLPHISDYERSSLSAIL
eukprot:gene11310-21500_t